MSGKAKPKPGTVLIPLTRQPGSRSTSGTPVDPCTTPALPEATPAPALVPAPKTLKEAISLLKSHGLITKNPQLSPAIISGTLLGVANFPKVIENSHNPILSAIALLVPEAMASANIIHADLDDFKAKFMALEEKVNKVLGLVENPMTLEEDVGEKLDKMMSTICTSASKAEAAEQAAISMQNKLTSLLEAQSQTDQRPWHRVTPKNSSSHKKPAPHSPAQPPPARGSPPACGSPPARGAPPAHATGKPKDLDAIARQQAHAQAASPRSGSHHPRSAHPRGRR
ncbi:hypothetical protein FRC12_023249 [Ceratobasidium sp. 428]|nr:hypothetical protein FRC12_023249 [Ceratobasidium sp. 428]